MTAIESDSVSGELGLKADSDDCGIGTSSSKLWAPADSAKTIAGIKTLGLI